MQRSRLLPSVRPGSRDEVDGCGKLGHNQSAAVDFIKCSGNLVISKHGSKYAQNTTAREAPSYPSVCLDSSLANRLEHGQLASAPGPRMGRQHSSGNQVPLHTHSTPVTTKLLSFAADKYKE